jgi:flavin-binding protein dodecin
MAKKGGSAVYRVTEVIGTSSNSWEEATRNAVRTASKSLRDLRVAEITKFDVRIDEKGKMQFRARVSLSFKYEA